MIKKDIRKNPYRGILTQVAIERGCTRQNITYLLRAKNYEAIRRVNELVAERDAEMLAFSMVHKM